MANRYRGEGCGRKDREKGSTESGKGNKRREQRAPDFAFLFFVILSPSLVINFAIFHARA